MANNPLLDKEFLDELDHTSIKEVFARVTALNLEEETLECIEGLISSGSVSVDGTSSVRRTCTVSLTAHELNIHEFYWGLRTKFKLEVGLRNTVNPSYPDIIWFSYGVFVLTSFNTSQSASTYTVSLQGKDKMTLLNGELGGTIYALTHNFGVEDYTDEYGMTTENKLLLKDIIINAVHEFGKEPLWNIIVNDLDDYGLELMEYRGKDPMYLLIQDDEPVNMTLDGDQTYYNGSTKIALKNIPNYNPLFWLEQEGIVYDDPTEILDENGNVYTVAKLEYGMTAGYRLTGLTYAGDLILNVGETVTAMLDKIKSMLGEFEYFYDIDGRFIFQRRKTYLSTSFNNINTNLEETWAESAAYTSAISYSFEDSALITSFTNSPNYANIRNDFSIWGTRKSVTGKELPVHMRFAIDKKPLVYKNFDGVIYTTMTQEELEKYMSETTLTATAFYTKKPNPQGLPEEWWDIFDWAEYYKKCVGEYPNGMIGLYCTNGGVQFSPEEMYSMFPKGSYTSTYFETRPVYIFDVEADGTLGYTGHGTGCTHLYQTYFMDQLAARGATAFIYCPMMPKELEDYVQDVITNATIKTEQDWRELIYQMAIDFRKHNREEDFYITIGKNNPYEYSDGMTGYEQYYTDMEGFWRQLYNPEYENSFKQTFVTKRTYEEHPENYYYSVPRYTQCSETEPYHSNITYYSYQEDENAGCLTLQPIYISKIEYVGHERDYYFIKSDNDFDMVSCIITEPYRSLDKKYYNAAEAPIANVTESAYNANPSNYWFRSFKEVLPCLDIEPYKSYHIYYSRVDNTEQTEFTQEQYEANPYLYYRLIPEYKQCQPTDPYSSTTKYYCKEKSRVTDQDTWVPVKTLSEINYKAGVASGRYWTFVKNTNSYCATIIPFVANREYCDKDGKIITFANAAAYEAQAKLNTVFYNKYEYTCCIHPIPYSPTIYFYESVTNEYNETGWVKAVYESPELLNFWFDFLDEDSELQKYSCHNIGNRPKAVNDTNVKSIYFRDTPTVIFVDSDKWNEQNNEKMGYTYIRLPESMESLFSISAQGKSAKTVLDDYLYKYACCAETISISCIPIHHLEPNTRIFVHDENSGINGEYIMTRFSVPLGHSGTMNISATKAVDPLY